MKAGKLGKVALHTQEFTVMRHIEHDDVAYVPRQFNLSVAGFIEECGASGKVVSYKVLSASHGGKIPVDTSGVIELAEGEAKPLLHCGAIARPGDVKPVEGNPVIKVSHGGSGAVARVRTR